MGDSSDRRPEPPKGSRPPTFADFFWIGMACAISVVGAGAVGFGLDSWLGTTPALSFAGLAFGIVSAVLLTVAQVRKFL
ncbi:MAG TPA: AtpZ/AtpI family protein [Acidimicrobiales bacterium]|nr:AtpZ/AtpI family protein [Acidimicrobiales bacterium]